MKPSKSQIRGRATKRPRNLPGSSPGILIPRESGSRPHIEVIRYSAEGVAETTVGDAAAARALTGTDHATWIIVQGADDPSLLDAFGEQFGLHRLAIEDVDNTHQRPKFEEYEDCNFIVLRVPDAESGSTQQLSMFQGKDYVLCFFEKPLPTLEAIRARIRQLRPRMMEGRAEYLAYAIVDLVVDLYFPVIEDYEKRIDAQEDDIFANVRAVDVARIHELKRDLGIWHRLGLQTRDVISRLLAEEIPTLNENTRLYLRDCLDHARHVVDQAEAARDRCGGLLDLYLSVMSHRMNEIMRVLTVIATIFMPLAFIAGLYGMNFDTSRSRWNMPELGWALGYPFALGVMVLVAAGLMFYFHRKGWFGGNGH